MYKKEDIVELLSTSSYDLKKTKDLIKEHFPKERHAGTTSFQGDVVVEFADAEGALVGYQQVGYSVRGYLYYPNKWLKLIKSHDAIINQYQIY